MLHRSTPYFLKPDSRYGDKILGVRLRYLFLYSSAVLQTIGSFSLFRGQARIVVSNEACTPLSFYHENIHIVLFRSTRQD